MPILRGQKDKNNPYVMINKKALCDPKLSAKAKGIHSYLMTLPDDWKMYTKELTKHFTDGRDGIAAGLQELEKAGYLLKKRIKTTTGKFDGFQYTILEYKGLCGNSAAINGFTDTAKPETEIPSLLNNNLTNNELNNINIPIKAKCTKKLINLHGSQLNVKLTEDQYNKLINDYEQSKINDTIEDLSCYMKSKGKRYKDHAATIRAWVRKDNKKTTGDPYADKWNSLK